MINSKKNPEEIIGGFFNSIKDYILELIDSKTNIMDGLYEFAHQSWEIPKKYKGNSSQLGFVAEYLVFETVKQHIERRTGISFLTKVRTKTFNGADETYYFLNNRNDPSHLLCQGLRINDTGLGLPNLVYAHDISYLIKESNWLVKAIFEVKSFFDFPSLKEDIKKLEFAEKNYPLDKNYALVFVGFKNVLSRKEKELISKFTIENNHYCVLPGKRKSEIGNSLLEEVLNLI